MHLSAYFVLLNLLAIFLMDAFIFSGLEVVLLSIALSICFSKKVSKFESAFAQTGETLEGENGNYIIDKGYYVVAIKIEIKKEVQANLFSFL